MRYVSTKRVPAPLYTCSLYMQEQSNQLHQSAHDRAELSPGYRLAFLRAEQCVTQVISVAVLSAESRGCQMSLSAMAVEACIKYTVLLFGACNLLCDVLEPVMFTFNWFWDYFFCMCASISVCIILVNYLQLKMRKWRALNCTFSPLMLLCSGKFMGDNHLADLIMTRKVT